VSLCLRFDFLKSLNIAKLNHTLSQEKSGTGKTNSYIELLVETARNSSKHYFIAVLIGYLLAIISTVVIMIVFQHGQPALLYLVPGCLISVGTLSLIKGEFSTVWNFDESEYILTQE